MTTIEGAGTTEDVWLPFLAARGLPALALDPAPARVVVLAPHPDDEVLGVGGLIALLAASGSRVEVVAVTDGEASHPGGSIRPDVLADLRSGETRRAVAALGVTHPVRHLHLPDGGCAALTGPVVAALHLGPGDWLLAPWSGDGHPDHEAVGRAAELVADRDGARLLAYPVWAWHWADPGTVALPWERALRVGLPAEVQAQKALATASFVSQIEPIGARPQDLPVLPAHVLARFSRPFEVVFG